MGKLKQTAADVLMLSLACGCCVGLFMAIGGESDTGLMPYYNEVTSNALGFRSLAWYVLRIVCYAMLLEVVIRFMQHQIGKRLPPLAAILVVAFIYAATHLKFNLSGAVYGASVGIITATFFQYTRRTASLVVWHACWEVAAVGFVLVSAMFIDGGCRFAIIDQYKQSKIQSENLRYVPKWGWIDDYHMTNLELIETLTDQVYEHRGGETRIEDESFFSVMIGEDVTLHHVKAVQPASDATRADCHAMVCAALWEFETEAEIIQGRKHPISGAPISSFSFEDLSSVMFACYLTQPGTHPKVQLQFEPPAASLRRWADEKTRLIPARTRRLEDVTPVSDEVTADLRRLQDRMRIYLD